MRSWLCSAKSIHSLDSSKLKFHSNLICFRNATRSTSSSWAVASKFNFAQSNLSKRSLSNTTNNSQRNRISQIIRTNINFDSSESKSQIRRSSSSSSSTSSTTQSSTPHPPKPYYITTPIFYVNAIPHIGHLHSMVLADVLARWNQWRYNGISQSLNLNLDPSSNPPLNAILSTGTDEHGLKIQTQAHLLADQQRKLVEEDQTLSREEKSTRLEGIKPDPKALCDRISQRFKALAEASDISYSRFIRSTEPEHSEAVKHLWSKLVEKGHIYKGSHEGWYAISDEAFYTSLQVREVIDEKTGEKYMASIETGTRVEWTKEENYKFKMSEFREKLIDWLENDPKAICPPTFHAEVLAELKSSPILSDLSISRPRSRLEWGIQVPNDPDHTIYVWVDALTNYLTVSGYPWKEENESQRGNVKEAWQGSCWPADVHVVGKDIIRFHAIYFPSLLLALDLPLPKTILTHSHWTMNKQKMSKSRGNVADPFAAMDLYGVDAIRWYLMRVGGTLDADSDYSPFTLQEYYKKNLGGQLGNLLSRISSPLIHSKLINSLETSNQDQDSSKTFIRVPIPKLTESDLEFVKDLNSLKDRFTIHMDNFALSRANEEISTILMKINTIVHDLSPWLYSSDKDGKSSKTTLSEAHRAIYLSIEVLRIISTLYHPIMPNKMEKVRETLGFNKEDCSFDKMIVGAASRDGKMYLRIGEKQIEPLFPKVKDVFLNQNDGKEKKIKKKKKKAEGNEGEQSIET